MALPVTPGLSLSASQILAEFAIPSNTTSGLSNYLFPRIEGSAGSTCSFSSFSGKSTLNRFTYLQQTAGNHGVVGIAVDYLGNIIVGGFYSAGTGTTIYNLTLPPTSSGINLPTPTNYDMFLLKYNSAGTLIGYTTLNGNNVDQATELVVDSAGSIYVTGEYSSTAAVNIKTISLTPAATVYNLPISTAYDVFVIKWNVNGNVTAFTNLKASGSFDQGQSIRVDSSLNVYIAGYYTASVTVPINMLSLTPTASGTSLPATTGQDGFVIKWNSSGTLVSYTSIKGSGSDAGMNLAVDSSLNVYLTGYYNSTSTVPINTMSLTPAASGTSLPISTGQDGFVIKWNSGGTLVSYTTIKGNGSDSCNSIAIDSSFNVYVTGYYNSTSTVPINTMSLTPAASGTSLPISTGQDGFVIKWNSSGTLVSYTTIKGTGTDSGNGIAIDAFSNVYVFGSYNSTSAVTINTMSLTPATTGKTLPISASDDMFFLKYNSIGTLVSYTYVAGTSADYANRLFIDSQQNVYFTALYSSTGTVPVNTMNLTPAASGYTLPATSGGVQDMVVFKHGKTGV